jgi:chemotaxis protein MotB
VKVRLVASLAALGFALALLPRANASSNDDRSLVKQLDNEIIALRQKIQRLEGELAHCGTTGEPGKIYPELVQVFSGSVVTVDHQGAATRVTLPGDLLFSSNGMTIRDEAGFALDLLSTALKLHPEVSATFIGHTDADPPPSSLKRLFPTNWELSTARATAFARAIVEKYGVPAARVTVAGRGGNEPVASNDTPEGRALNRRVVVLVVPQGGTAP